MQWEFDLLYALQDIHTPVMNTFMTMVTRLGNGGIFWVLLAIILFLVPKTRSIGLQIAVAMILGLIIGNGILKNLIARDRPCWIDPEITLLVNSPKDYSFPSGHSMHSFIAATVVFLNAKKSGSCLLVLAALIAFSRLYLFVHFPTDVLCGSLLGIGLGCLVYYNRDRMRRDHALKLK